MLELGSELQVHDGARMAGVDDRMQPHAHGQRVHQQPVDLIVHNLARLYKARRSEDVSGVYLDE